MRMLIPLFLIAGCSSPPCMEGYLRANDGTCVKAGSTGNEEDADADTDSTGEPDSDGDGIPDTESHPVVDLCPAEYAQDSLEVVSGSVSSSNVLELSVSYTGGCTSHYIFVCWDGEFSDDEPPEIQLQMMHDSSGDNCSDPVAEDLSFRLVPLLDAWYRESGNTSGTLMLSLENQSIDWSF